MDFEQECAFFCPTHSANPIDWVGAAHNVLLDGIQRSSSRLQRRSVGASLAKIAVGLVAGGVGFEEMEGIGETELSALQTAAAATYDLVRAEGFVLVKVAEKRGGLSWEALTELAWASGRIERFEGRFDELLDLLERLKSWEARIAASPLTESERLVLLSYGTVLRHSSKFWLQLAVDEGDFSDGGGTRLPEPPKKKCIGRKKRIEMDAAGAALMALDAVNSGKDAEGVQQAAAIGASVASGGPATV